MIQWFWDLSLFWKIVAIFGLWCLAGFCAGILYAIRDYIKERIRKKWLD